MLGIAVKKVQDLIATFDTELAAQEAYAVRELTLLRVDPEFVRDPHHMAYLNKVIADIPEIIRGDKTILNRLKGEFDAILISTAVRSKAKKTFREKIFGALNYAGNRTNFYPKYFRNLGINACVYCNSQLTVAVDPADKRGAVKAKFQVDHYLAKAHYPCFSISLFNLYPVCASCNNCKGTREVAFNLYSNNSKSDFSFVIDSQSKADYLDSRNPDDITIEFIEPPRAAGISGFDETFDISGIYATQIDIVEELILKSEVYTESYKEKLIKDFGEIFTDINITNRLIIGNYVDESDIHLRPMAKFIQDISKQVGLIKDP